MRPSFAMLLIGFVQLALTTGCRSTPALMATREVDLAHHSDGERGTLTVLNLRSGEHIVHDRAMAGERAWPASTFKIPNSLMALTCRVVSEPEFTLAWDPVRDPQQPGWPDGWDSDQTLRSAFARSTVWYYQKLARRIGLERSRWFVQTFAYGNAEIGTSVDTYWLHGPLMISPIEQTEFLKRLWRGELPVSKRSRETVRDLMLFDSSSDGPSWRLFGKTGTARLANGRFSTWLVGIVERDDATFAYAMRADMSPETFWMPTVRRAKVKAMLQEVGVLPDQTPVRAGARPS